MRHWKEEPELKLCRLFWNQFYICHYFVPFSGLLLPLSSLQHCFTHSKIWILHIRPQSSVPGKSQDDVRLDPALPHRPAFCYFHASASVVKNPTSEHRYSAGQSSQSPHLGWICESWSSSRRTTDLPLSMSFLPLYITLEESRDWVNTILGCLYRNTLHSLPLFHVFITWMIIVIYMLFDIFFRNHFQVIHTSACTINFNEDYL